MLSISIQKLQKIPKILISIFLLLLILNISVILVYKYTDYYLFYGLCLLLDFDYEMNLPTFFQRLIYYYLPYSHILSINLIKRIT